MKSYYSKGGLRKWVASEMGRNCSKKKRTTTVVEEGQEKISKKLLAKNTNDKVANNVMIKRSKRWFKTN